MQNLTICSPELGISPESNSGGEVYDREVLLHLAQMGVKILILLPKNRDYPQNPNLKISYAPIKPMFPPYIFNLFVYNYLNKTYKLDHFDIVRVHSPYFVGPAAVIFKKFHPEIPLVASYLHLEENNPLYSLIDRAIISKFDQIVTISQSTKKEIISKYKIKSSKISVAYPGVSEKFKPQRKNNALENKFNLSGKKVLLFLGGLKKRKNPLFLIDIFKQIKDQEVVLLIAGEGNLKNKIVKKTFMLGLQNRVVFTGFVPENQKANFYNLADVVLLPSVKEGFGMIAAEAGACGKPVIASDNSSLPEIIKSGKTGFLAETNNLDDWVSKISILLKSKNTAREMGCQAEKYVRQNFSWNENAQKHLEVFRRLS